MAKVTVLVAVYNASRYLATCLDSLLSQTLADFQVVCIDDGSTDDSLSILRHYADHDPRFEVIHLEQNQGQARARNVGLKQTKGEFVCFLDADDWLELDALARCVAVFEHHPSAGAVLFEVSMDYDDHSEYYAMPSYEKLSGEEAFRLSLTWQIHGVYMVRADIHRRYPYDETCKAYSDDNTTRLHYLVSEEVRRCDGVYHYRQHADSVTHAVSVRRYDYLRANESMRQSLFAMQAGKEVLALYENHRWLNLIDTCMFHHVHGAQLSSEERQYGLSELHRVWKTIDRSLLDRQTTHKFGYRPMPSWTLFRMQEWLYFTLRGCLGRNY